MDDLQKMNDRRNATPVITKPGKYKTRDGRCVSISKVLDNTPYTFPCHGRLRKDKDGKIMYGHKNCWMRSGYLWAVREDPLDIIGPW